MMVNRFRLDGGECYDSCDEGDGEDNGEDDSSSDGEKMAVETIVEEIEKGPMSQLISALPTTLVCSHQSLKNTSLKYNRNRHTKN